MSGKLDEISRAIGSLETSIAELHRRMDIRERLQDVRHDENQKAIAEVAKINRIEIEANKQAVGEIREIVKPLCTAVEAMTPIVATYQISHWKKAGALGLAITLLSVLGWLAEAAIGKAVGYMLSRQ